MTRRLNKKLKTYRSPLCLQYVAEAEEVLTVSDASAGDYTTDQEDSWDNHYTTDPIDDWN